MLVNFEKVFNNEYILHFFSKNSCLLKHLGIIFLSMKFLAVFYRHNFRIKTDVTIFHSQFASKSHKFCKVCLKKSILDSKNVIISDEKINQLKTKPRDFFIYSFSCRVSLLSISSRAKDVFNLVDQTCFEDVLTILILNPCSLNWLKFLNHLKNPSGTYEKNWFDVSLPNPL